MPLAESPLRIGVVVATWEDTEQTIGCLGSLLNLQGAGRAFELKVVVSDDASSAQLFEDLGGAITTMADEVTLVRGAERSGYAATVNRGIAALRDFAPDFLWVLNNDTRFDAGALEALIAAAEQQPQVAIWGSTVVAGIQGQTIECAGGYRYNPLTTRNAGIHAARPLSELENLSAEPLHYVHGAAMFIPTSVLASAGGLCEDYFLYFEEQDLVRRLPQPVELGWCRNSLVYHVGAASTGGVGVGRSQMQQYYENLSTLRFTGRFYPWLLPWVFGSRLVLKPLLFALRGEWQLYAPFAAALADYLCGKPARRYR